MNAIHLFTFRGIPVFVSPMYFLLLLLFGYRDPAQGVMWAIGITISLLVHEFGHALVARHLRHDPSIMLHTFGGLTSRSRTGRDVEEAAIVAMGPAAGLLLGLVVFAARQLLMMFGIVSLPIEMVAYTLLYPCVVWNLLNLLPMWPLDGGQLFRLGFGRWLGPVRAARVTHIVSIAVIALLAIYTLRHGMYFSLFILVMLGMQNIQGLQGQASARADSPRVSPLVAELIDGANAAMREGNYKEAARLAHQARAQEGVSPTMMEKIWEILGVATEKAGEYEEALAYLKRARPNTAVRAATEEALSKLGRQDELAEFQSRWTGTKSAPEMSRWLTGALGFIALALALIFSTSLSQLLFR